VRAAEYEAEAPAGFNLPETPVLYISMDIGAAHVWVASDGLYLGGDGSARLYALDEALVGPNQLCLPDVTLELTPMQTAELSTSLGRCRQVFGPRGSDAVDVAEAADYESGTADDLGAGLVANFGEGPTSAEGAATAVKRARDER